MIGREAIGEVLWHSVDVELVSGESYVDSVLFAATGKNRRLEHRLGGLVELPHSMCDAA